MTFAVVACALTPGCVDAAAEMVGEMGRYGAILGRGERVDCGAAPKIEKDIPVDPIPVPRAEPDFGKPSGPSCKFTTNVDYAKKELANRLGVDPNDIGDVIHKIKKAYGVGGAEKLEFNV